MADKAEKAKQSDKNNQAAGPDKEGLAPEGQALDARPPTGSTAEQILYLQRTVGNQVVQRLIESGNEPLNWVPGRSVTTSGTPSLQRQEAGETEGETAGSEGDTQARALYQQGQAAFEAGNYEEALQHFESAVTTPGLQPNRLPRLVYNIALSRAYLGDVDGAMTDAMDYRQYHQMYASENDPPAEQLIGRINQIQGQAEGGTASQAEGAAEGESAGEGTGEAGPQSDEEAQAIFQRAREAHDAGRYEEALRLYEEASAAPGLEPRRSSGLAYNIALARARLGDFDNAMTAAMNYQQLYALHGGPHPPEQLMERINQIRDRTEGGEAPQGEEGAQEQYRQGQAAYDAGNYEEALRHFETAADTPGLEQRRLPRLLYNIALSRARLGDYENAHTAAAQYGQYHEQYSEEGDPSPQELNNRIGQIRSQAEGGSENPQSDAEAQEAYRQGHAAYQAGRYEEALQHLEAASAAPGLEPSRQVNLTYDLALARAYQGDYDNAYTEALRYGQLREQFGGGGPTAEALRNEINQIRGEAEGQTP